MSEGGTPRDERFATPRTFRTISSKSDSKSEENNSIWQTPRTTLRRQVSISSNHSNPASEDFETPRIPDGELMPPPSARSHRSNSYSDIYIPQTARSNTSELNQYATAADNYAANRYQAEEKHTYTSRSTNIPYLHEEKFSTLSAHTEQDEYELGVGESITEQDIEDIFSYARHGRIDDIEFLLSRGMPINIRDEWGSTLLIIACQNGNKRVAKLVLRRGADINAKNHKGNTPLHYCYQYGYGESLGQYLISKGADSTMRNNAGKLCWDGI